MRAVLKIACHTSLVLVLLSSTGLARAQDNADQTRSAPPETAAIAQGWSLLAQGNTAKASALSAELLKQYPRSAAVLTLAVDTDITRGGPMAGLSTYERWLGSKTTEDGYVLRRVAHALLRDMARDPKDRASRVEALEALQAEGDAGIAVGIDPNASASGIPEAAVLASMGNEQATKSLIAELNNPMGNRRVALAGLARSQSPLAVDPLIKLLADDDPYFRGAAAEALAKLGATRAVASIKPLLDDPVFSVHLNAAGALLTLKDTSGLSWLQQLQTSEHSGVRLAADRDAHPALLDRHLGDARLLDDAHDLADPLGARLLDPAGLERVVAAGAAADRPQERFRVLAEQPDEQQLLLARRKALGAVA